MSVKQILLLVLSGSLLLFLCLAVLARHMQRRNDVAVGVRDTASLTQLLAEMKQQYRQLLQRLYVILARIPVCSTYVRRMRKRISFLHPFDEISLRYETMKLVVRVAAAVLISAALLIWSSKGPVFFVTAMLAAAVLHDLILDLFLNRLERKLLRQSVELFSNIRHHYQQHGMVEEAIYEAAETADHEISIHAHGIYQALVSQDPEEALERFYETSPNRYLKAFAGISHLVLEFGDHEKRSSSIFLKGISSLTKEIQLEILRRDKLDYLLKGLNIIALIPVFFTTPIEWWARSSFPAMDAFYMSKLGVITKLVVFVTILVSYVLLQRLHQNLESEYRAGFDKSIWEARVLQTKWLYNVVSLFVPEPGTAKYERRTTLLKESNTRIRLESFYLRRLAAGFVLGLFVLLVSVFLQFHAKHQILYSVPVGSAYFGSMNQNEKLSLQKQTDEDRQVIQKIQTSSRRDQQQVIEIMDQMTGGRWSEEQLTAAAERVLNKWHLLQHEFLKWWEVFIAVIGGILGSYFPLWLAYFNRKVRRMEMKHEVYQFQTVISVLREMDRISVEEILEWMNRFAFMFKAPIQKAILHFEHGADLALQELKEDIWFPEFRRLVDQLMMAVDLVPIKEVFDDLEGEMAYVFEQRRQEYEKMIDVKAAWGRFIGFTPMYALVFLYLVIPLIGMSFDQMNDYYEQIQKI
ncbi:hypothetical protein [Paenibacillus lemnae]|uniref:GTPase SAR1 n=1 Tax=Paenibacillus lemnae TaxID=1330551 RepID=A0A848M795_PAELE|nr:hypothetical protein [Paenibacillus lemnae]NMO95952.1 hypothetical protein [Paenibacillus lemnae]